MSCGNLVHPNPSTNRLTEKKHSKRKAPYRPLERTGTLNRKSRVEDWSTICKKKYSEEKGAQPSINENKNHYDYTQEGLRKCHMKNQSEEMGALWSAKKPPPRRTGQKKGQRNSQKKQHSGEKGALEKRTTMKKNLVKKL